MSQFVAFIQIVAALVCATLAGGALLGRPPLTRKRVFFAAVNTAIALWILGYAVSNLAAPGLIASMSGYSSPLYWVWALTALGLASASLYWFLFGAALAGLDRLTRGWPLVALHVPAVYALAIMLSNPSHLLYETVANGTSARGPLALPHQIVSYGMTAIGTYLIIRTSWRRNTADGRRQAFAIGATAIIIVASALTWDLRIALGLEMPFNPTPVLFSLLSVVLVYEALSGGFPDLLPLARLEVFEAMADAAIVVDPQMRIAAINPAAGRMFPRALEGDRMETVHAGIARHAYACLHHGANDLMFETHVGDAVYWGRVRHADVADPSKGCVVLLTDLTELRHAQTELIRMGRTPTPARRRSGAEHTVR
ncbi:MAG: histidine kinase N-terminal 7TM domain-containing protein [Coriobacteriia bacterium]